MVQPLPTATSSLRKRAASLHGAPAAVRPVELESGERAITLVAREASPARDDAATARVLDLIDVSVGPIDRFLHYPAARTLLAQMPSLTSAPLRAARVLAGVGSAAAVASTHDRGALFVAFALAEAGLVLERASFLVATTADRRKDGIAAWTARVALVAAMAVRAPANPRTAALAALTIALGLLSVRTSATLRPWVIRQGARPNANVALRALATAVGLGSFEGALPILHVGLLGALFASAQAALVGYLAVTWIATGVLLALALRGERAPGKRTPRSAPATSSLTCER